MNIILRDWAKYYQEDMMKTIAILTALLILAIPVMAQEPALTSENPQIYALGILGKGLAISQGDPLDFKVMKFGLARVRTEITNESTELSVGILYLDDARYIVRDFVTGDGHSSGDIYANDTKVGSYDVQAIEKGDSIIWAGTMTVESDSYNVYLLEGKREVKSNEIGEKNSEYCEEYPERCQGIIKGIRNLGCDDPATQGCREKIRNFCENNVNDTRCQALFRSYCVNNMDDVRCRSAYNEYCQNNPEAESCNNYRLRITAQYCEDHPTDTKCVELQRQRLSDYCLQNTDDAKCAAVKTTAEFMDRIRTVKQCYDNPDTEECESFCESYPAVCKREQIQTRIMQDVGGRIEAIVTSKIRDMNTGGDE
jgi:hypothetical protein